MCENGGWLKFGTSGERFQWDPIFEAGENATRKDDEEGGVCVGDARR